MFKDDCNKLLNCTSKGRCCSVPPSAAFVIAAKGSNKVCVVIFVIKLNNTATIKLVANNSSDIISSDPFQSALLTRSDLLCALK